MGMRALLLLFPVLMAGAISVLVWFANRSTPTTGRRFGAIAVLLLALGAGAILQGSFLQEILLIVGGLYLLAPFSLVLIGLVLVALCQRRSVGNGVKEAALIWFFIASALTLSYGVGTGIRTSRENATRADVARIIQALDEIKSSTGAYPAELPVALKQKSAWAFQVAYSSDGKTFRFGYDDPAGMMDGCELYSEERVWHHFSA